MTDRRNISSSGVRTQIDQQRFGADPAFKAGMGAITASKQVLIEIQPAVGLAAKGAAKLGAGGFSAAVAATDVVDAVAHGTKEDVVRESRITVTVHLIDKMHRRSIK